MRSPFYMDHLRPEDRKKVRRLMVQVIAFYFSMAFLVAAGSALNARFLNPHAADGVKEMRVSR